MKNSSTDVTSVIRHEGDEWVLYTGDESRVLGRHPTKEKAVKQEQAIEISKHKKGFLGKRDVEVLGAYIRPVYRMSLSRSAG